MSTIVRASALHGEAPEGTEHEGHGDLAGEAHSRRRTINPQGGELRNAYIDRQELVEVVSLSKLSFF